jgi:hypothetical protein
MSDGEDRPVQADPTTYAALYAQVGILDTDELTAHAQALGIRPPDDRPDWSVVLKYAPDLTERGLFWIGPDDD